MEKILLRFSHLREKIFNLLDNKGFEKSREVDRYWNIYINEQKFYKIRKIKATVERFQEVGPAWNILFAKSTTKMKSLKKFPIDMEKKGWNLNFYFLYSIVFKQFRINDY